jgi:hypothetical protein
MGTSSSSSGSPSGTPMVPPWVPDPVPPAGDGPGNDDAAPPDNDASDQPLPSTAQPVPIAPPARFGGARLRLGRFARTGSANDMRKGVGHYVRKGLGGGGTAVRRLGGTARTAGALYGALSAATTGQASGTGSSLDPAVLAGRSADEVMSAVVEAVRPVDGTQDGEASRAAIGKALSELLTQYPDADLLNLSEEQRLLAVERFIAWDVFNRFELDLGKTIQEKAPSVASALSRLREVRDFITQIIAAEFRKLTANAAALGTRKIASIVRDALGKAVAVFESYL